METDVEITFWIGVFLVADDDGKIGIKTIDNRGLYLKK
jgi:hypothetical protein